MLPKELLKCFHSHLDLRMKKDSTNSQALTEIVLEELQKQIKYHFPSTGMAGRGTPPLNLQPKILSERRDRTLWAPVSAHSSRTMMVPLIWKFFQVYFQDKTTLKKARRDRPKRVAK